MLAGNHTGSNINGFGPNGKQGSQNDGRTPTKRNGIVDNRGSQNDHSQNKNNLNTVNDNNVSNKKRTLNEMLQQQPGGMERSGALDHLQVGFGMGSGDNNEGAQIEQLLHGLKKRVLNGETLHNFKKEIAQKF